MTSERLRPAFGKMAGLWRMHHGLSEIFELLENQRVEQAAATVCQLLKASHQAALDQGSWALAATLLPWDDPLAREPFGGDGADVVLPQINLPVDIRTLSDGGDHDDAGPVVPCADTKRLGQFQRDLVGVIEKDQTYQAGSFCQGF